MQWVQKVLVFGLSYPLLLARGFGGLLARPKVALLTVATLGALGFAGYATHRHRAVRWTEPVDYQPAKSGPSLIAREQLEEAVTRYYVRSRRLPEGWDDLARAEVLRGMPPAPAGQKYVLDITQMSLLVEPMQREQ